MRTIAIIFSFTLLAIAGTPAQAQSGGQQSLGASLGVQVFPAAGQNASQQSQDEAACYEWAVGNSGSDPFQLQQQQAANAEQAAAVLTQAKAPLYPQASYGAEGAKQRGSETGATPVPSYVPNPQTSYQVLAGASWELDLWGRIRRLSEAARAQLLATEEARRGVILSLVASVANGYVQLQTFDEQLMIARHTYRVLARGPQQPC